MTGMLLAAVAVLELHGTPYERGLAHGTTLKVRPDISFATRIQAVIEPSSEAKE